MLVKFSSVVVAILKGTWVSFTDTPKVAFSKSKHNENGKFIVRFVGIPGLNNVCVPLKVMLISLIRFVMFRVMMALAFNNWMLVLLFLGNMSAINWSGIGGTEAVISGQNPILLVSTNKAMRIAEGIFDFFILSRLLLSYYDAWYLFKPIVGCLSNFRY